MLTTDDPHNCAYDFFSVTSNTHNHVHEHTHPHTDSENDLERVQRLAMFLESHFGEVHMSVPEPEKGHEQGQNEEAPEPVLLIRLDEADALVHLRSMVSYRSSAYFHLFLSLPLLPVHFPSSAMGLRGSVKFVSCHFCTGCLDQRASFCLSLEFVFPSRRYPAPTKRSENVSRA